MIITISGTPGTGKTAVAKELWKLLGWDVVSIAELVKEKKLKSAYDRNRKTRIVDEKTLDKDIRKFLDKRKNYIIDGGLAHFVKGDICIVLRANPAMLERRMKKRKWPEEKIKENIEAEILDVVTAEALDTSKNIIEIDTSKKTAKQTALLTKKLLNNHRMQKIYRAGRIDWSERYRKYLVGCCLKKT